MKRKFIVFIIAILVGILIGYIIYSKTNNYNSIRKIDIIVVENDKIEDKGGSEILDPPITEDNQLDVPKEEISIETREQTSSVKNNNQQNNNNEEKQVKENNNVSSNVVISPPSEKKEEIISNNEDNKQPEINIESPKEEPKQEEIIIETPSDNREDLTLQELKNHTFPTYQDCQKKGIEIGLTDTVGIDRTYCESVGYKGELVGYKLFIIYATGEIKEYKW